MLISTQHCFVTKNIYNTYKVEFFMNKFAERLKELRLEKGLNISGLGKEVGINYTNLIRWESGERQPSIDAVIILAKYFDVTTDYILGVVDTL